MKSRVLYLAGTILLFLSWAFQRSSTFEVATPSAPPAISDRKAASLSRVPLCCHPKAEVCPKLRHRTGINNEEEEKEKNTNTGLVAVLLASMMVLAASPAWISFAILAQTVKPAWAYTEFATVYPCEYTCQAYDVAELNGEYYMAGIHRSSSGVPDGNNKFSAHKVNSAGDLSWTWDHSCYYTYAYAYGITATHDGWLLVAGNRRKGCTGSSTIPFVAKLSNPDTVVWLKEYTETGSSVQRIMELSTGSYAFSAGSYFFIVDTAGTKKCVKSGPYAQYSEMAEISGYVYAVGRQSFNNTLRCMVSRFDTSTCTLSKTYIYGDGDYQYNCYSIKKVSDGNFVIAGSVKLSTKLTSYYLVKANPFTGDKLWERIFGTQLISYARAVLELSNGELILVGSSNSAGSGRSGIWVIRTDSEGTFNGEYTFTGTTGDYYASSAQLTSDGAIAISGYVCESNLYKSMLIVKGICPATQYLLPAPSTGCATCMNNCLSCVSAINCNECISGYYLYKPGSGVTDQCLVNCPDGYYANTTTRLCTKCLANCTTCSIGSACLSCASGYYRYGSGQCLTQCPDGYFVSGTNCYACDLSHCKICANGDDKCVECMPGYYYYTLFAWNYACKGCESHCLSCTSLLLCTVCAAGYYLTGGSCALCPSNCLTCPTASICNVCADSYFVDSNLLCSPCSENCQTCSDAFTCTKCLSDYYFLNDACFSACPDGYYPNSETTCAPCLANCKHCASNSACGECADTYYLYRPTYNSYQCLDACPTKTFADESRTCHSCVNNCDTCTNSTKCVDCSSGYYKTSDGLCVDPCQDGYFKVSENMTCGKCLSRCKYCTNTSVCTTCYENYYISGEGTTCLACMTGCYTCTSNTTCNQCSGGRYWLYNSTSLEVSCPTSCPSGYYYDSSNKCQSCTGNCTACIGSTLCDECKAGFFIYTPTIGGQQCLENCPSGYFGDLGTRTCKSCIANCSVCSSTTKCITCNSGLYVLQGEPEDQCKPCGENCKRCRDPQYCLACYGELKVLPVSSTSAICVPECPTYMFENKSDATCYSMI